MANDTDSESTKVPTPVSRGKVDPDAPVMFRNVSTVDQTIYPDGPNNAVTVLTGDTVIVRPSLIAKLPRPWFVRVEA